MREKYKELLDTIQDVRKESDTHYLNWLRNIKTLSIPMKRYQIILRKTLEILLLTKRNTI